MGSPVDEALDDALWDADVTRVAELLAAGADPNTVNSGGCPVFAYVARAKQHGARLARLMLAAGADAALTDPDGWTALHFAMYYEAHEVAEALLEAGADPNARDGSGRTPLDIARSKGMTELLTRHGGRPGTGFWGEG